MPIIIIREQNVDGCGGFADVCVQCDDPVTSEQMMELHHELVRLTKELKDLVWEEDYTYYSRKAVNNHVSNLRRKLKIAPDLPDSVKSVYGIGYKFEEK